MINANRKDVLVSIITPVYNSEEYIGDTIKSAIANTHENWEMFIADDCSQDSTAEVISQFKDERIKYFKLDENAGAAVARNKALEKANGNFIAFLDADDMWKPDKLQKQLEFMIKDNIGFSFTGYEILKEEENKIAKPIYENTIIGTLTVMINVDIVGE